MGRRSDHTREQLYQLILAAGHLLMAEVGPAEFSAREVAKRIGYSVGTIYNVFGSVDTLLLAINSLTFMLWADQLRRRMEAAGDDRIAALVEGYFDFAQTHSNLWTAIYDRPVDPAVDLPPDYRRLRAGLTGLVEEEIGRVLPRAYTRADAERIAGLARSLVATVHGHCTLALNGTFALLGEPDPRGSALARVRETLAANGAT